MYYLKHLLPDYNMLQSEIIVPIIRAMSSIWDYITVKFIVLVGAGGLSGLLGLGLFETPSQWWKGLVWLVVIDWVSGCVIAILDDRFDFGVFNEKWRQVIGYTACCAMAAILANSFPTVFYYLQFLIYVSFYIKEGVSILKTFKLLAFVQIVFNNLKSGEFEGLVDFQEKVDARHEENLKDKKVDINISEE